VVVHGALVDGGLGLRDQLCAPHVAVPFCRVVDCDLCALFGVFVGGVFVRGREVNVFSYGAAAVDVVLVRPDLVGPGPWWLCELRACCCVLGGEYIC
jgi:hypothetical protein